MTPLEFARMRNNQKTCENCANRVLINDVNYCEATGKLLIAKFVDEEVCRGMRFKKKEKSNDE